MIVKLAADLGGVMDETEAFCRTLREELIYQPDCPLGYLDLCRRKEAGGDGQRGGFR